MPAERNLDRDAADAFEGIWRGDPFAHQIAFGTVGDWQTVSPDDFEASIRRSRRDPVLADFTITQPATDPVMEIDGTAVTVPKTSVIVLGLDATITADVELDRVDYDLQQTAPTAVTILYGWIAVAGDITR